MNKKLKDDLSKILTYHVDGWYNEEGNKEGNKEILSFEKVIKTNLFNKADVYNQRNNQRNIT